MDEREESKPRQSKDENATTDKLTIKELLAIKPVPDSDPMFKRGFVIGGKGFNRSRQTKKKPE